jgi:LacI family transcriptional regulator
LKKKATIYDIARELKVTISTVSRALSDSKSISEATKKSVWEMAKKLNYSPNKLAASLKSGKTYTIGVIVPSMRVHFFASVIHSIELSLKKAGYSILLYQSNENLESEKQGVKTLLEAQVDGFIASLSLETTEISHFEFAIKQGKSVVFFDRTLDCADIPSVMLDDFKAGYMAGEHLIKKGYKNISYIAPLQQISIFKKRVEGFLAALDDYKIPVAPQSVLYGSLSIAGGNEIVNKIAELEEIPGAFIGGDDFTGLGAIQQLRKNNILPPKVGVMGFANEVFSEFITPSLTTIEQQPQKMGSECARIFLAMIKKKNPFENPEKVILEPILIERESTKRKEEA